MNFNFTFAQEQDGPKLRRRAAPEDDGADAQVKDCAVPIITRSLAQSH
jgi:hypothetical protein